ncbi:MAG TPA: hypothetical protein VJP77_03140, partial [Planctomycetota bacterium]|nr:hypothetical protein [Planctomycetota bacterium]
MPTAPATAPAAPLRAWFAGLSPRWLIAFLITVILVVGQIQFGILKGLEVLATALGVAVASELALSRFARGRWGSIQSAYISGISATILTRPQEGLLWPFALVAAISIASKYALTYRGRHLWNPTNFGISATLLIAPGSVAVLSTQFDNSLWPLLVIWSVGLLVASRARILHVTASYLVAFLALSWLRTLYTGEGYLNEIAPVTSPMYQLFLFFMITDPPTTVSTKRGRIGVAVLVAVVECGIRLLDETPFRGLDLLLVAPPIFALAIVGPVAKLWDLTLGPGRVAAAPPPARPAPAT